MSWFITSETSCAVYFLLSPIVTITVCCWRGFGADESSGGSWVVSFSTFTETPESVSVKPVPTLASESGALTSVVIIVPSTGASVEASLSVEPGVISSLVISSTLVTSVEAASSEVSIVSRCSIISIVSVVISSWGWGLGI